MKYLKFLCRHKNSEIIRWHYFHGYNGNEPKCIEIELGCPDCHKTFYRVLHDNLEKFADQHKSKRWS